MKPIHMFLELYYARNESIRYQGFVRVPIVAIFLLAAMIVASRAVHQEYEKVDGVKVWYNTLKATNQTP